jgi:peptidoglycan pentaglycine glycine transferase (the first glycine)
VTTYEDPRSLACTCGAGTGGDSGGLSVAGFHARSSDAIAWNVFISAHPEAHLLQTGPWGDLKSRFGWEAVRLTLEGPQGPLAGAQVLFRPLLPVISRVAPCLAYVPHGPVVDWEEEGLVAELIAALHRLCRQRRAILLKIEPDLPDAPRWASRLIALGFRPSPQTVQPPRTILVDLRPAEEEILAAMKAKARYNIRLAGHKGVTVRAGTAADLPVFCRLAEETAARDAFAIHSADYYSAAYELFAPYDMVRLFLAEHEGEPLAGLMAFAHGERAWYIYGASSDRKRELMPNYLLQWEAMRWAKACGCRTYDLWGIPDEDEETLEADFTRRDDGLWGVYRFKRGFGGRVSRYVGAWDYVYSPSLYRLFITALARLHGRPRTMEQYALCSIRTRLNVELMVMSC